MVGKIGIGLGVVFIAFLAVGLFFWPYVTTVPVPPCDYHAISITSAIYRAEKTYAARSPDRGFAPNLNDLQLGVDGELDWLAAGVDSGSFYHYRLRYESAPPVNGVIRSYSITLIPDGADRKCKHSYYLDESGRFTFSESGPATINSPVFK